MRHLFLLIILISALTTHAQFKKYSFEKGVEIKKEDKVIHFPTSKADKLPANTTHKSFTSINFNALSAIKCGLSPGQLNENSVPVYIEGKLKSTGSRGMKTENLALEYLETAGPLMKVKDASKKFKVVSIETDALEMTHVRFQQLYHDIPVYGAEVIVHGENSNFDFLNGTYFSDFELENITPAISINACKELVKQDAGVKPEYNQQINKLFASLKDTTSLVIYPFKNTFYLAYHATIYKNLVERWEYFIDAQTGEMLNKYPSICKLHNHTKNNNGCDKIVDELLDGKATANAQDLFNTNRLINTYEVSGKFYMIDGSRDMFSSSPANLPDDPEGVIWTIDAFNTSPQRNNFNYDHVTSSNNIWNNKTAVSAHYNGGKAFEYYRTTHNRKSINGNGGNIISMINVADDDGTSMGNAYWNGAAMFYGNGDSAFLPLARGLDVAGHEMTHGVVQGTANLEYEGESGALNESFADIFGVMIDREDWKIGEDVVKVAAFPSGALRSMEDPHNGAATNDFNRGWQPRHFDERYKGSEDNGGVHINSGIPNFAFFKFATAVGKDKAEKVYYRALSNYLTKSSKFVDCRVAVIKAATDLYGTTEINAAKKAYDDVGIFGEQGGDYETDIETNPGQEFILTTNSNDSGLFIYDTAGNNLGQISSSGVKSKPSVSDNGSEIVFVGSDDKIHYIFIDWTKTPVTPQEQIIGNSPVWRNAIISKDGLKIAALTKEKINEIEVFYFGGTSTTQTTFELFNPTFSDGVSTGDVNYADAMEFDVSGEYIMYDAENEISSTTSGSITYWDIGFIKVWNNESNSFSLGKIEKLFSSLPEDVSVGNPTFSKNSPYIVAFDYVDELGDVSILGANTESGDVKLVFENNTLGYPNYSNKDNKIIFDNENNSGTAYNLGVINLKTNKIEPAANATLFVTGKHWAVWFSNGSRELTSIENVSANDNYKITLQPNPVIQSLEITLPTATQSTSAMVTIKDILGKTILSFPDVVLQQNSSIFYVDVNTLSSGTYFIEVLTNRTIQTAKFIKQ